MNKINKRFLTLALTLVVAISMLFSGCKFVDINIIGGGEQQEVTPTDNKEDLIDDKESGIDIEIDTETPVVTYVSVDSKLYSSTAEVVKAVCDTVVEISTETVTTSWGRQYIASGAGSGVIVGVQNNTYYIITNNHVIEGASEITVRTRAGVEYSGKLLATDDSADIATLGNSDDLQIGEDLIAIGNPLGSLGGTVTKGILSATGRKIRIDKYEMTLLQTDTAINPGNSGGGLFNMKGELIGVVNAKTSDEEIEGICFAIPINNAIKVYNDLIEYGYILGRATFNIEVSEATLSSSGMGSQAKTIVYITSVSSNSSSGFRQYDMIYKINGMEITSILDFNLALSKLNAGDSVEVEVYRGSVSQSFWSSGISFENDSTTFTTTTKQYGE